jgi:hypothetical protein
MQLLPQICGSHLERLKREIPIHGLTSNNHAKRRKAFLCIQIHLTSRQTTLYNIPSEKSTRAAPLRKNWWFRKKDSAMWKEACKFDSTAHVTYSLSLHFATHQYPPFVFRKCYSWLKGNQEEEIGGGGGGDYDATRSGVSASTDNKAVCTLSNQLSNRSRRDLICGIPRTLGCTQETCTVPSTWSIIPSIRWTCCQNHSISFPLCKNFKQ